MNSHNLLLNYIVLKNFCIQNNIEAVNNLLVQGVDPRLDDNFCLRYCCENGFLELSQLLIKFGADYSSNHYNSLKLATINKHEHIAIYLLDFFHPPDVLQIVAEFASTNGCLKIIKKLINKNFEFNKYNFKCVQIAATIPNIDSLCLLLEHTKAIHIAKNHMSPIIQPIVQKFEYDYFLLKKDISKNLDFKI